MSEFNKCLLYLLIVLMVVTGSINTIATKVQQKIALNTRLLFENHQWFLTFEMFIGELSGLVGYLFVVLKRRKVVLLPDKERKMIEDSMTEEEKEEAAKPQASKFVFSITASCDLTATTLSTFGITYLSSSVYQMFRGLELLFVMFFSKFFIGNPIYRHHVLGVGLVVFGLSLVGLNSVLNKDSSSTNPILGIVLLIISQLFSSSQYVIQEKIMVKYSVHPFQLVGFEGFWGCAIYILLLIIFQQISCDTWNLNLKENVCYGDLNDKYLIENTVLALRQMGENIGLLFLGILYITSIALYNYVGIKLTKLVSSTARAVVDTVRTIFVWFFFLWFPWVPASAVEKFYWLQLIGFIFLILGTIVYNEIIPLPFWNLNYYFRERIAERKAIDMLTKDIEAKDSFLTKDSYNLIPLVPDGIDDINKESS